MSPWQKKKKYTNLKLNYKITFTGLLRYKMEFQNHDDDLSDLDLKDLDLDDY